MPQTISYIDPYTDFDDMLKLISTSLRLGLIHEDTAIGIENTLIEIVCENEDFGEDFDAEWCGIQELFDLTKDKGRFVELLRNAYFVYTNYDNLKDEEVAMLVLEG